MSSTAVATCWGDDFPAPVDKDCSTMTARLVALAIADVVNDMHGWEFYGSIPNIARKVGLNQATVRRAVQHLVDAGVMSLVEERPGRTTKYRWDWKRPLAQREGSSAVPDASCEGYPSQQREGTPRSSARGTESNQKCEQKPPANAGAAAPQLTLVEFPQRTPNQLANEMQKGFWRYVESRTGRPPLSVNPVGFQRLMAHFIEAKVTRGELGQAVERLWSEGRPITKATIEAQIDGRRPRGRERPTIAQEIAEANLRYDCNGNLLTS